MGFVPAEDPSFRAAAVCEAAFEMAAGLAACAKPLALAHIKHANTTGDTANGRFDNA